MNTRICSRCRAENEAAAEFCSRCGKTFEKKIKKSPWWIGWLIYLVFVALFTSVGFFSYSLTKSRPGFCPYGKNFTFKQNVVDPEFAQKYFASSISKSKSVSAKEDEKDSLDEEKQVLQKTVNVDIFKGLRDGNKVLLVLKNGNVVAGEIIDVNESEIILNMFDGSVIANFSGSEVKRVEVVPVEATEE